MHDSVGWGPARLALLGPSDFMGFPYGQSFAADKHGNWYMGIREQSWGTFPYESAMYSRFQGDTWIWPVTIAEGDDYIGLDYGLPLLVARPDTGFWVVYSRSADYQQNRVLIDHLAPTRLSRLPS